MVPRPRAAARGGGGGGGGGAGAEGETAAKVEIETAGQRRPIMSGTCRRSHTAVAAADGGGGSGGSDARKDHTDTIPTTIGKVGILAIFWSF